MKLLKKMMPVAILLLMFSFLVVGYAALASQLSISGVATSYASAVGVRITSVTVEETTGGVSDLGTRYEEPTNVISVIDAAQSGTVTYKITVENDTDMTFWYRGVVFSNALIGYRNDLVNQTDGIVISTKDKPGDSGTSFDTEDWIPPHTVREFYAVYTVGINARGELNTMVNFSFGEKILSYSDEVLAILNTPERYELISNAFNELYAETGSNVLGNIGADSELFDEFFESELKLNGENVTIMIQRENVDGKTTGDGYEPSGPSGCEYTMYLTIEDPTTGEPTVYAVSYTTAPDGTWRQIGELYEGTATLGTYTDSEGNRHTVFDINTWEAVQKTYVVFSYGGREVTYMVGNQYGNAYQQQTTIPQLMSMEDIEMYNRLDDHPLLKDVYKILQEHQNSDEPEVLLLRDAYNAAAQYFNVRNNGAEFKVIRGVYTRAEIIANLEALALAMEYYQQSHQGNHT